MIGMNIDEGNTVVFLDLIKKAFDTVDQDILLRKLELHGMTRTALSLNPAYTNESKVVLVVINYDNYVCREISVVEFQRDQYLTWPLVVFNLYQRFAIQHALF